VGVFWADFESLAGLGVAWGQIGSRAGGRGLTIKGAENVERKGWNNMKEWGKELRERRGR